jgi:hypothetical protein
MVDAFADSLPPFPVNIPVAVQGRGLRLNITKTRNNYPFAGSLLLSAHFQEWTFSCEMRQTLCNEKGISNATYRVKRKGFSWSLQIPSEFYMLCFCRGGPSDVMTVRRKVWCDARILEIG